MDRIAPNATQLCLLPGLQIPLRHPGAAWYLTCGKSAAKLAEPVIQKTLSVHMHTRPGL